MRTDSRSFPKERPRIRFATPGTVYLGSIEQRESQFNPRPNNRVYSAQRVCLAVTPLLRSELPRSKPDLRNPFCRADVEVTYGSSVPTGNSLLNGSGRLWRRRPLAMCKEPSGYVDRRADRRAIGLAAEACHQDLAASRTKLGRQRAFRALSLPKSGLGLSHLARGKLCCLTRPREVMLRSVGGVVSRW
jgi:hypothetical protein